jgi:hypothetical protein
MEPFLEGGMAPPEARADQLSSSAQASSLGPQTRLVTRLLRGERRRRMLAALACGHLRVLRAEDVLDPEKIAALAQESLWLLVGSGAGFALLNAAARVGRAPMPLFAGQGPVLGILGLLGANALAYLGMVPVHEGVHALAILALGGRPRFGLRLPWAAYCTAPGQVFTRAGYLSVALAPLLSLSALGVALTWLAPNLGAYLWFGFVGNVAGAVGDLGVARQVRPLPADILVADTETGYIAYQPLEERASTSDSPA